MAAVSMATEWSKNIQKNSGVCYLSNEFAVKIS